MTSSSPGLVPVPASPGKRVAALFVDVVGAALIAFVASSLSHGNIMVIVTILLEYAAVQAIMIAIRGRSIGCTLTGVVLVSAGSSMMSPSLGRSFGYVLVTTLSAIVLPVPFVSVFLGGERGSWMASLCSLECLTFAPRDEYAEASAPVSPYSSARSRGTGGYTNFGSVTAAPSVESSMTRESQDAAQPRFAAPQDAAPRPVRAMPQAPGRPITPAVPAQPAAPAAPAQASPYTAPARPQGAPAVSAQASSRTAPARPQGAPQAPPTRQRPVAAPPQGAPRSAPRPASATHAAGPSTNGAHTGLLLDTGQSIPVDRTIVLGRAPSPVSPGDVPIPVDDQTRSLSRTHVRITPTASGISIVDMNSANGTRARTPNGRTHTLVPGQPLELPLNSQLLLGERLISVVDLRQRR
ncbi:FHA domain-containing protein [uncultured Actinomyces sp.]|uniref:FHA domain-containing protein n=1 Tax=uncultured Actinomyces sp. TaxID=249061 RepID=UPI0028E89525|nr:FHA domain-containing protein [uncultured Actinomyces sp.]